MDQEEKQQWEEPALIVLVRGKPEEAVLYTCKTEPTGCYPGTDAQHCGAPFDGTCGACQARGGGAS